MPEYIKEYAQVIVASPAFKGLAFSMTLLAVFTTPFLYAVWHLQGTPLWAIPIHQLVFIESLITTFFFVGESIIFYCAFGRSWLKSPMATINALVIVFSGTAYVFESFGLANPRILRLLRQLKGAARVSLTQRTRTRDGVLGSKALIKLNEDDTWQALFILMLFSISTGFGGIEYFNAKQALIDIVVYVAIALIMVWKSKRNSKQIRDVFIERMNNATLIVSEKMKEIPGLNESAIRMSTGRGPIGKRENLVENIKDPKLSKNQVEDAVQYDEISNLVDSVLLIILQMKRFISRRTFEEAKGREVLPPDKPVALWFSDIANFSDMTREMGSEIISPLRKYFAGMHHVISSHFGDIDKFIGDAVFAFFHHEDCKLREQITAHALMAALSSIRRNRELQYDPKWDILFTEEHKHFKQFNTRIGLHLGCVIAGPIGSEERADSTLIGEAVNITARLESLNKHYDSQVLMSENFVLELPTLLKKHCRMIDKVALVGHENTPMKIYCLDIDAWPEQVKQYFEEGVEAYLQGEFDIAYKILGRYWQQHPNDGPTQTLLKRLKEKEKWADSFHGYWICEK